jgi:lysosomal Pro-X carboxypeptidase
MGNSTVLFYTGNESPLEQYINNTGLMWELGERLSAQIVFVEHRYEGKSRPSPSVPNCMAYSSSIQALADYANFIDQHLFRIQRRPVITFGGSYGGMLSAWMRMKYPNIIAGAVAASAPVWGFPRNFPRNIDSAWQVVQHGLKQQYPPTDPVKGENNFCSDNLLATWPLVHVLAEIEAGRDLLTKSFRLCEPLRASEGNGQTLIDWAQSPWFDFAEGSFPYPSSYIPYALTHNENAKLPAWPLQAACWVNSSLHQNLGVVFDGNISNVQYEISYATDGTIAIDWDQTRVSPEDRQRLAESPVVAKLLSNVRDAVSVWFNVTHDVACYNLTAAPNRDSKDRWIDAKTFRKLYSPRPDPSMLCSAELEKGSWPALCCNEVMNLIITDASGLGRDFLWPPSHPRGTSTYADTIISRNRTTVDDFCQDPEGVFGYSQEPPDPWATWYDVYYGGIHIESHSNIVFSNGLLDPWSAAGVYAMDAVHPFDTPRKTRMERSEEIIPGLYVQNISQSGNMVAVIMEYGGHHTDLMYSSDNDPPSITKAREVEESYIRLWINEWWNQSFQCAASKK